MECYCGCPEFSAAGSYANITLLSTALWLGSWRIWFYTFNVFFIYFFAPSMQTGRVPCGLEQGDLLSFGSSSPFHDFTSQRVHRQRPSYVFTLMYVEPHRSNHAERKEQYMIQCVTLHVTKSVLRDIHMNWIPNDSWVLQACMLMSKETKRKSRPFEGKTGRICNSQFSDLTSSYSSMLFTCWRQNIRQQIKLLPPRNGGSLLSFLNQICN